MAVGVVMRFTGATPAQYDQVIEKMGFEPGGRGAPNSLFHWVTETDDGILVTDVWDSREEYEKFAQEQIGPYAMEAGFPGPPEVTIHEVHNHLTGGG